MDKKKLRYAILKVLEEKKDPFNILVSESISDSDVLEQGKFLHREGYIINTIYADNTIFFWGGLTEKVRIICKKIQSYLKLMQWQKKLEIGCLSLKVENLIYLMGNCYNKSLFL